MADDMKLSDEDKAKFFWIATWESTGSAIFATQAGLRMFLLENPSPEAIMITTMSVEAALKGGMAPSPSTKELSVVLGIVNGDVGAEYDESDFVGEPSWSQRVSFHVPYPSITVIK
jgi:hypothetical protein